MTAHDKVSGSPEPHRLAELFENYYRSYYLDELGLADWRERTSSFRTREEEIIGEKLEQTAQLADVSLNVQQALVVGCGSGAEMFYLAQRRGVSVVGIDPSPDAVEICQLKAAKKGLSSQIVGEESVERLSFAEASFDLIICFTVLEHVSDVDRALQEMIRVLAPGGQVLLVLPNYAYPEEPHYKILTLPPAWFPFMVKCHLKHLGKPTALFDKLNFMTKGSLRTRLRKLGISHRFVREYTYRKSIPLLFKLYCLAFGIDRNLIVVLEKQ